MESFSAAQRLFAEAIGTALLVFVYWMRAQTMMVDPTVAALTPWQAVGIG